MVVANAAALRIGKDQLISAHQTAYLVMRSHTGIADRRSRHAADQDVAQDALVEVAVKLVPALIPPLTTCTGVITESALVADFDAMVARLAEFIGAQHAVWLVKTWDLAQTREGPQRLYAADNAVESVDWDAICDM